MGVRLSQTAGLTPEWFRPISQADVITPAEFLLRPLTSVEKLDVFGLLRGGDSYGQAMLGTLRRTVTDWRGVHGEGGEEVKYSPELLGGLPSDLIQEIGLEILARTRLTDAQKKT
jgi:hypothetical protein